MKARWTNFTADQYHANEATSRSQLVDFIVDGPEEFHSRHVLKEQPRESSDEMDLGTIAHDIILRGNAKEKVARLIPREVLSIDKNNRASRRGAEWDLFAAQCEQDGVIPLLEHQWQAVDKIRDRVMACQVARTMIETADRMEASCEWQDEDTGLVLRVMFDIFASKFRADLKTTKVVIKDSAIAYHLAKMNYHIQAAFYERAAKELGCNGGPFVFIFQKATVPWTCRCYEIDADDLRIADAQVTKYLGILAKCIESDTWSPPSTVVRRVKLPSFIESPDRWSPEL